MKVINAVWEEKNLDRTASEIICEEGDSPEELNKTLYQLETSYNVLKIPAGLASLLQITPSHAFSFAETQVQLCRDLPSFRAEDYLDPPLTELTYAPMNEEDRLELFQELDKGLFSTDRIALDPKFSIQIANKRYKNWLLQGGSQLFKISFQRKNIGFFAFKDFDSEYCSAFLTGLYSEARGKGFGRAPIYFPLVEGKKRGQKLHVCSVSLNNKPIINLHIKLGSLIRQTHYVFVKHSS